MLNSRPIPSNRSNPCPVCDDATGNCRILPDVVFCHTFADSRKGESIGEYICVKESNGHTATFALNNKHEWTAEKRAELNAQKAYRKQLQEQANQEENKKAIASQLSDIERDKHFNSIFNKMPLNQRDRDLLLNRGFSLEQIEFDQYRSLDKYHKIGLGYPDNLPGYSPQHGTFSINQTGIIAPIRDINGRIISCQVRLHNAEGGRYRWLLKSKLNNELPLSIFEPESTNPKKPDSIWLTEGTIVKPSLTRYRLGVPVIGASGGNFSSSPSTARDSIEHLSKKYDTKKLVFAIDAGDATNNHVMKTRKQQFEFFASLGYQCFVSWWGQTSKEDDDIDELTDVSVIRIITVDEFLAIANEHQSSSNQSTANREATQSEENQPFDWIDVGWRNERKFTPDRIVNQQNFSFPKIPDNNCIVAVKSGLGTGKTSAMIDVMKKSGKGNIIIGYRNNLLFQTISRASQEGVNIMHYQSESSDARILRYDDNSNIALCLDSLHHVDGCFRNRDIWLDEACSVALHGLGGGTLGNEQAKALKLLSVALEQCDRVFLMDGNLSDRYVDAFAKFEPNKKLIKIENQQKVAPHQIFFCEGFDIESEEIKKRDRSGMIKLMMQKDVVPFVYCDSKERTQVIAKLLESAGKQGILLNADTSCEKWAKDFLENPDSYIQESKPDFVIISPSGESGLSITIKDYFTHKFSIFCGVASTNSQLQGMFRLRDNSINHYVFCPEVSMVRNRAVPLTFSKKKIEEELNARIAQSIRLAIEGKASSERMLEVIGNAIARSQCEWWELSLRLAAIDNMEQQNLKKCLMLALRDAGHNIEEKLLDMEGYLIEQEKEVKEEIQRERAKEIFNAVEFNTIAEAQKKKKSALNKEVMRRIEKTYLLDKIPNIDKSDVWNEDFIFVCHVQNQQFINQVQNYWLMKNFEISHKKHESEWFYAATGEHFFTGSVVSSKHQQLWGLQQLNILQFQSLPNYHKDSPEVVECIKKLRENRDIQIALNLSFSLPPEKEDGSDRIQILDKLLARCGLKNKALGKKTCEDGMRRRCYQTVFYYEKAPQKLKEGEEPREEYDFKSSWEAIEKCVGDKFITWNESKKSIVKWVDEIEKPIIPAKTNQLVVNSQSESILINQNASDTNQGVNQSIDDELLRLISAQKWQDVNQSLIDKYWNQLSIDQQKWINNLHIQYQIDQGEVSPIGKIAYFSYYGEWKQAIIKAWENSSNQFKAVVDLGYFQPIFCWERKNLFFTPELIAV